jgi:hypothetical protein
MDRQTKSAVATVVVAILVLLILAFYGYMTGAWEPPPA